MHHPTKDLPVVEDYGDGFCSRLAEWGGMIVSYETFPKGVDAPRRPWMQLKTARERADGTRRVSYARGVRCPFRRRSVAALIARWPPSTTTWKAQPAHSVSWARLAIG